MAHTNWKPRYIEKKCTHKDTFTGDQTSLRVSCKLRILEGLIHQAQWFNLMWKKFTCNTSLSMRTSDITLLFILLMYTYLYIWHEYWRNCYQDFLWNVSKWLKWMHNHMIYHVHHVLPNFTQIINMLPIFYTIHTLNEVLLV